MVCKTCNGFGLVLLASAVGPSVACPLCYGKGEIMDEKDTVNHPKHYTFGKIEVIDVIEDWQLEYHEGNCIKYIARAKHKGNELEDLKKAQWYLNRKIKSIEYDKNKVNATSSISDRVLS